MNAAGGACLSPAAAVSGQQHRGGSCLASLALPTRPLPGHCWFSTQLASLARCSRWYNVLLAAPLGHRLQPLRKIEPLPDSEGETQWGLVNDDAYAPDYSTCYPVLVVAPTSVLENWEREFDMWGKFRQAGGRGREVLLAYRRLPGPRGGWPVFSVCRRRAGASLPRVQRCSRAAANWLRVPRGGASRRRCTLQLGSARSSPLPPSTPAPPPCRRVQGGCVQEQAARRVHRRHQGGAEGNHDRILQHAPVRRGWQRERWRRGTGRDREAFSALRAHTRCPAPIPPSHPRPGRALTLPPLPTHLRLPARSGDPGEELLTIPWHMALFDEAHFLKNSLTKVRRVPGWPACGRLQRPGHLQPLGFAVCEIGQAPLPAGGACSACSMSLRGLPGPLVSADQWRRPPRAVSPAPQRYMLGSRLPTRLRYGLTGTPFQNDYAEIWAVMNFMAPGEHGLQDSQAIACLSSFVPLQEGKGRGFCGGRQAESVVGAWGEGWFREVQGCMRQGSTHSGHRATPLG